MRNVFLPGNESAGQLLHKFVTSPSSPDIRQAAVEGMGVVYAGERDESRLKGIITVVHERFDDVNTDVRKAAYAVCATLPSEHSIGPLRAMLERDKKLVSSIRKALDSVYERYGERPSCEDAPAVLRWLGRMDALRDKRASKHIQEIIETSPPDKRVLLAAVRALGSIGDPVSAAFLTSYRSEIEHLGDVVHEINRAVGLINKTYDEDLAEHLISLTGEDIYSSDATLDFAGLLGKTMLEGFRQDIRSAVQDLHNPSDLVVHLDSAADVLIRQVYSARPAKLGIDEKKANEFLGHDYSNRLQFGGLANLSGNLANNPKILHNLRHASPTPHSLSSDHRPKPQLTDSDAAQAKMAFNVVLKEVIAILKSP
jgi:HEAT repeat protein